MAANLCFGPEHRAVQLYGVAQPLGVRRISSCSPQRESPAKRHEIGMKVVESWADMREKGNHVLSCEAGGRGDTQVAQSAGNGEDELPDVAREGVPMIWKSVASGRVEHAQEAQGSEMSAMGLFKMVA